MNKFVVIGDCHIPFQDKAAIKAFLRFIKKEFRVTNRNSVPKTILPHPGPVRRC